MKRSMNTAMKLALIAALVYTPCLLGSEPEFFVSADLPAESRQFDFWVGEWDVNLRTIQEDASWKDTLRSEARIYPILDGKAVLELWNAEHIKGFSLRYFDVAKSKWVLWLNWPGRNRSGSSSLEGEFRHGRGEFTSNSTDAEGKETIQVYSFNDITPTSLRWDDSYSTDGGRTWAHQWIMEFSRQADVPTLAAEGGEEHTFVTGDRCDLGEFRRYEFLAGARTGVVASDGDETAAGLKGYRVLDGCAVLLFLDWEGGKRFAQLTYNTFASRFELLDLDAEPGSPARILYGGEDGGSLVFLAGEEGDRVRVTIGMEDGGAAWVDESETATGWETTWQARFGS